MAEIDPDTLLEWLTIGQGDERDMQLIALEQLCMLLLMSDNVDRCFESCPPRTFLPALCNIFMDDTAPENILEVTARAITYYLDVSAECSRRIVSVEGAVKALCTRLVAVDIGCRTSKDLAEQCVKVLELMCTREAGAIYEASGLTSILTFIREYGFMIHKDTLHSAMSVVARLCTKMEPNDSTLEDCVDSLSRLLKHEDTFVADGALRCFACLADRFTRRGVDPAPLAKHGLTDVLLEKLVSSALVFGNEKNMAVPGASPDTRNHSGNVSIIVSVLSTLCRGSPSVTHDLLRSDLLSSLEKAMQGDERCVLDTMRLVDLLLILLFEGRDALPKSTYSSRGSFPGLRRMDSSGERSHRQLIDCIRSKDTDALIEAIDSGAFEVNFMDDVGQTLLNWASAFGTLEMVEFLCERGADVNRGQRSSSLHYAACFGRPAVAKVLLRYGANQDLRDEDGKTPLDKARERNDEGHKEVVRILQSPGEWIAPLTENQCPKGSDTAKAEKEEPEVIKEEDPGVKGDPEMAPVYVQRLLPIFSQTFLSTLIGSIRKATLAILKKMIHYAPADVLSEAVMSSHVSTQLVDVISSVLNAEDDEEGHLTAFQCVEDLMTKSSSTFLVHFVRLGVLNKLSEMMTEFERNEEDEIDGQGPTIEKGKDSIALEDASTIVQGKPYHWHDWCIVRGRDCLYIWSDYCAIELSNGSNGWFRFILDGKLATMYSSGSPEGGSGSSESRSEFLEKLQRAKGQVAPGSVSQPILSSSTSSRLVVGNWSLSCQKEGTIVINNADGQQATILKEDLLGFVFESNRATKHTFTAETSLGPDFSASWNGKPGRKYQSRKEQMKQKVCSMAKSVFEKHFRDIELTNCGAMRKLHEINDRVMAACNGTGQLSDTQKKQIYDALSDLCDLFKEENMLSTYEIQSSGLVTALFNCLNRDLKSGPKGSKEVVQIFKSVFGENIGTVSGDDTLHQVSHAVSLVRKLIAVLESSEKLPVLSYDGSGSGSGLQVLLRRLRFKLERDSLSTNLVDRSNRFLKMEPLTTVGELEKYLLKMVAKQWYDYDRSTFKFIQHLYECKEPIKFQHNHDFDENGIVFWVGTNAKTVSDWVNPAQYGLITVTSSEGKSLPYGRVEDILSRDQTALNCHTNDDKNAWFAIDVGLWILPSAYTIRHARGYGRSALRNWLFQGSKDGMTWTTLSTHKDDSSLAEPGSTATYPVDVNEEESSGWRMFKIQQAGPNASGQTHYLSLSGFELYGAVTGVSSEPPGLSTPEIDPANKKQRRLVRSQMLRQMTIAPKEVTDWKLLPERARQLTETEGVGNSSKNEGWVDVSWVQNTAHALQKLANDDQLNVKVVDISDPDVQATISEVDDREREIRKDGERATLLNSKFHSLVRNLNLRDVKAGTRKNTGGEVTGDEVYEEMGRDSLDRQNDSTNENQAATRGLSVDFANLQLLMAVEDLLGNTSSDLVASALAEAASLDQLRAAARSLKGASGTGESKHFPSYQGSRESGSPPDTSEHQEPVSNGNNEPKLLSVNRLTTQEMSSFGESNASVDVQDIVPLLCKEVVEEVSNSDSKAESQESVTQSAVTEEENNGLNLWGQGNMAKQENQASVSDNSVKEYAERSSSSILGEMKMFKSRKTCWEDTVNGHKDESEPFSHSDELSSEDAKGIELSSNVANTSAILNSSKVAEGQSCNIEIAKSSTEDVEKQLDNGASKAKNTTPAMYYVECSPEGEASQTEAVEVSSGIDDTLAPRPRRNTVTLDDKDQDQQGQETEWGPDLVVVDNRNEPESSDQLEPGDLKGYIDLIRRNSESKAKKKDNEDGKEAEKAKLEEDSLNSKEESFSIVFQATTDSSTHSDEDFEDDDEDDDDEDEDEDEDEEESICKPKILKTPLHPVIGDSRNRKSNDASDSTELKPPPIVARNKEPDTASSRTPNSKQLPGKMSATPALQTDSFLVDMEEDDMEYFQMVDGDDDDEFEDIENEEEPEEMYDPIDLETVAEQQMDSRRRTWDDEYVLKRQHSALIPAFDPRPGRTNIQQTQDIDIPEKSDTDSEKFQRKSGLKLKLRGAPTSGAKEVEIPLESPSSTIFSYVQKLTFASYTDGSRMDRIRRVWEPVYTIVYGSVNPPEDSGTKTKGGKWDAKFVEDNLGTLSLSKSEVIRYLQQNADTAFLRKWRITGTARNCRRQRNCSQLATAYKEFCKVREDQSVDRCAERSVKAVKISGSECDRMQHRKDVFPLQEVLDLIHALQKLNDENSEHVSLSDDYVFDIPAEEFLSKKLTNKLLQQIQNPLILASGAWPSWCEYLMMHYPMLFPFETRQMFFQATAFGCSRSIVWLQNTLDAALERARGHQTRRLETHEFRVGRLKHERVKVPRGKELLPFAMRLLEFHAPRKAVLEIEFQDEEGTGLGPSLEFYALVARELQRKSLGLWICSDTMTQYSSAPMNEDFNYYVHQPNGLFPAPYPQDDPKLESVSQMFHCLGIFLAKCLQDNRLVDIPLSEPFFKLLCGRSTIRSQPITPDSVDSIEVYRNESDSLYSNFSTAMTDSVFSECDFELIHPNIYRFFQQLKPLILKRNDILRDDTLQEEEKMKRVESLQFVTEHGHSCRVEDLGLTFQYVPPSETYGFSYVNLKEKGCNEALTIHNLEEYVDLMTDFCLRVGIQKQLEALRAGFCRVFAVDKLHAFSPREVQLMLSGEQTPQWTREDLMNYTEPKFGYSKESPGFVKLVNVLMDMTGEERKSFLQFATGCSSLPPGGLANLHPRLTVVRKSGEGDGSYPSVNTCVHYLKLPDYSSESVLKEKLLAATKERGFHLN